MVLITFEIGGKQDKRVNRKTRSEPRGEGHEINSIHAREQDREIIIGRTRLEAREEGGGLQRHTRSLSVIITHRFRYRS